MITLAHVETNITTACQNTCVGCNHFIPMQKPRHMKVDAIARDLENIGRIAFIERYALIGGEPLLHPKIDEILALAKASHAIGLVEVWTNGLAIKRMSEIFWQLVDEIDLTLYPGKPVDLEWIEAKCAETFTRLVVKHAAQDFTRLAYKRHASDVEARQIHAGCWYRTYTRVLDDGVLYRCCTSPFIPKLLLGLPQGTDGLAITGETSEEELRAFLESDEVLASCYRCAGHAGEHIGWYEARGQLWIDESIR